MDGTLLSIVPSHPEHARDRECRRAARACGRIRCARARPPRARPRRSRRSRQPLPGRAFGRRTAAGGDRPRAGSRAGDPARRRADREPRRHHGWRDRRSPFPGARRARNDDGPGDPCAGARAPVGPRHPDALRDDRGGSGHAGSEGDRRRPGCARMTVGAAVGEARSAPTRRRRSRPSALRFALRELRGGLRGFYIFIACIALGVAAIAGVGSVTRVMADAIASRGNEILGGDIAFALAQRRATGEERQFLAGAGTVSEVATLTGMARRPDGADAALVEVKAVDTAYPLYGSFTAKGGGDLGSLIASRGTAYGAVADQELLVRLGLSLGDTILVGNAPLAVTGIVDDEPDRLSAGAGFGPRLLISQAALDASGLVQPGSIV